MSGVERADPAEIIRLAKIRALHGMVRIMRDLVDRSTSHYFESLKSLVGNAIRSWHQSIDRGEPDFLHIHHCEGNARKLALDILKNLARKFGNREVKRIRSFSAGTQFRLNRNYDILGNKLTFHGKRLFPLDTPDRRFNPPSYRHGTYGHIPVSHPSLPELDLMDTIRVHGQVLCYYAFRYRTSRRQTALILEEFVQRSRPMLERIYAGRDQGSEGDESLLDLDQLLFELRDRIKHIHANPLIRYRRTSQTATIPPDYLEFLRDLIRERFPHLAGQDIPNDSDMIYLRETIASTTSRQGMELDDLVCHAIPSIASLEEILHHGDRIPRISATSSIVITSQVPVIEQAKTGKIDLVIWKKVKRLQPEGERIDCYLPLVVLDIKTRGALDLTILGEAVGESTSIKFASRVAYASSDRTTWEAEKQRVQSLLSNPEHPWCKQLTKNTQALLSKISTLVDHDTEELQPLQAILLLDGNRGEDTSQIFQFLYRFMRWFEDPEIEVLEDRYRHRWTHSPPDERAEIYKEYEQWKMIREFSVDEYLTERVGFGLRDLALSFTHQHQESHATLLFKPSDMAVYPLIFNPITHTTPVPLELPSQPRKFTTYFSGGVIHQSAAQIANWITTLRHIYKLVNFRRSFLFLDVSGELKHFLAERSRFPASMLNRLQSHLLSCDITRDHMHRLEYHDQVVVLGFDILARRMDAKDLQQLELYLWNHLQADEVIWVTQPSDLPYQSTEYNHWQLFPFRSNDWKQDYTTRILGNLSTPPQGTDIYPHIADLRMVVDVRFDGSWSTLVSSYTDPALRHFFRQFISSNHQRKPDTAAIGEDYHNYLRLAALDHLSWTKPFYPFKRFATRQARIARESLKLLMNQPERGTPTRPRYQINQDLLRSGDIPPDRITQSRRLNPPDFVGSINKTTTLPPHILNLLAPSSFTHPGKELIGKIISYLNERDLLDLDLKDVEGSGLRFSIKFRTTWDGFRSDYARFLHSYLADRRDWILTRHDLPFQTLLKKHLSLWFDLLLCVLAENTSQIRLDLVGSIFEYFFPWVLYQLGYRQVDDVLTPRSKFDLLRIISQIRSKLIWTREHTILWLQHQIPTYHGILLHGESFSGLVFESQRQEEYHATVINLNHQFRRPFAFQFDRKRLPKIVQFKSQSISKEKLLLLPHTMTGRFVVLKQDHHRWIYWRTFWFKTDTKFPDIRRIYMIDEMLPELRREVRSQTKEMEAWFVHHLQQLPDMIGVADLIIDITGDQYKLDFGGYEDHTLLFDTTENLLSFLLEHSEHFYQLPDTEIALYWERDADFLSTHLHIMDHRCQFLPALLQMDEDQFAAAEYPETVADIPEHLVGIASIYHDEERCPIAGISPEELKQNPKYRTQTTTEERSSYVFVNRHRGCFYLSITADPLDITSLYLPAHEIERIHAAGGMYHDSYFIEISFAIDGNKEDLVMLQQSSPLRRLLSKEGKIKMLLDPQSHLLDNIAYGLVEEIAIEGFQLVIPYREKDTGDRHSQRIGGGYEMNEVECQGWADLRQSMDLSVENELYTIFENGDEVRDRVEQLVAAIDHTCEYDCDVDYVVILDDISLVTGETIQIVGNLQFYDWMDEEQEITLFEGTIDDIKEVLLDGIYAYGDREEIELFSDIELFLDDYQVIVPDPYGLFESILLDLQAEYSDDYFSVLRVVLDIELSRLLYRQSSFGLAIDAIGNAEVILKDLQSTDEKLAEYSRYSRPNISEFKGYYFENWGHYAPNLEKQMTYYEYSYINFEKSLEEASQHPIEDKLELIRKFCDLSYYTGRIDNVKDLIQSELYPIIKESLQLVFAHYYLKTFKFDKISQIIDLKYSNDIAKNDIIARFLQIKNHNKLAINLHSMNITLKERTGEELKTGFNYYHLSILFLDKENLKKYSKYKKLLEKLIQFSNNDLHRQYLNVLNFAEKLKSNELSLFQIIDKIKSSSIDYDLRKYMIALAIDDLKSLKRSELWFLEELVNILLTINSMGIYLLFIKMLDRVDIDFSTYIRIKSNLKNIRGYSQISNEVKKEEYPLIAYAN